MTPFWFSSCQCMTMSQMKIFITLALILVNHVVFSPSNSTDKGSPFRTYNELLLERKKWPFIVLIILIPSGTIRSGSLITPEIVLTAGDEIDENILSIVFINVLNALPYYKTIKHLIASRECKFIDCYLMKLRKVNDTVLAKMITTVDKKLTKDKEIALLRLAEPARLIANWNYADLKYGRVNKNETCQSFGWKYEFTNLKNKVIRMELFLLHEINQTIQSTDKNYIYSSNKDYTGKYSNRIVGMIGSPLVCGRRVYAVQVPVNSNSTESTHMFNFASLYHYAVTIINEKIHHNASPRRLKQNDTDILDAIPRTKNKKVRNNNDRFVPKLLPKHPKVDYYKEESRSKANIHYNLFIIICRLITEFYIVNYT